MTTLKDILEKFEEVFHDSGPDYYVLKQFLTTEITGLLEGLVGEEKYIPEIKPEQPKDKFWEESLKRIGSNQREQQLRDQIKEILK